MALIDDLLEHLSLTVKRDDLTKKILLLTCMSAYSPDPLNVFLKGESSIGKTHNAIQCVKYFPKKDVWKLGALSPTALAHDFGVLEDENNREIVRDEDEKGKIIYSYKDTREQITKSELKDVMKGSHYAIDLSHKILLFLEAPQFDTYLRLRPILSHDDKEIIYKFTDKTAKGSFSVRTAILRGWPATIFCTTESRWLQDLVTRSLNISPEETLEKYKEAAKVIGKKYGSWKEKDERLSELQDRVRIVTSQFRYSDPPQVFVPFYKQFTEAFPMKSGGDMRALAHYLSLIQNSALLNSDERPVIRKNDSKLKTECPTAILATYKDYQIFHEVFLEFAEASRAGIPKKALDLFNNVIADNGVLSPEDMEVMAKSKGISRTARQLANYEVRYLRDAGFIREVSSLEDKRRKCWEAIGTAELVLFNRRLNLQTSLCSFSLSDAQTFLKEMLYKIGIVYRASNDDSPFQSVIPNVERNTRDEDVIIDGMSKNNKIAYGTEINNEMSNVNEEETEMLNVDKIAYGTSVDNQFIEGDIDYDHFERYKHKISLLIGLNTTPISFTDFCTAFLFPELSPEQQKEIEDIRILEMQVNNTTLQSKKSSLDAYKGSAVDE